MRQYLTNFVSNLACQFDVSLSNSAVYKKICHNIQATSDYYLLMKITSNNNKQLC